MKLYHITYKTPKGNVDTAYVRATDNINAVKTLREQIDNPSITIVKLIIIK